MFNFFIGLIVGVASAALFGWVNYGSEERQALRSENANLKQINQELSMNIAATQDASYKARPLAQPAKSFGVGSGSSRQRRESSSSE